MIYNTVKKKNAVSQSVACHMQNSPLEKREKIWAELTYAKTSGTVTKDREKN